MRLRSVSKGTLVGVVSLVLIAVAVRAMLPYWVRDAVNERLARMGDYSGHVADVDIHLWRGAYALNALNIRKVTGKVPVPFVEAPRTDISVSWKELFGGSVVAEVVFERPKINFVDGGAKGAGQAGGGVDWRHQLEELVPIKLNEVNVVDGIVAFRAFKTEPPVDMEATDVDATITNLTNVRDAEGKRVAELTGRAAILGKSPLETHATFDPFGKLDDFGFDLKVVKLDLPKLNPLFQAYAKMDVAKGHGEFVMELEAKNGAVDGYMKPLFHDLDVLNFEQDVEKQKDHPFRLVWEAVTGTVTGIVKNHPKDQFATRIPLRGSLSNPKMGTGEALYGIFHNAFIEAFRPQLENLRPKA